MSRPPAAVALSLFLPSDFLAVSALFSASPQRFFRLDLPCHRFAYRICCLGLHVMCTAICRRESWNSKTKKSFPTFCLALSPSGRDEMLGNEVLCNLMCVLDGSSCRIAAIAKGWWLCTVLGADTNWLRFLAGLTCTSSGHTCRSLGAYHCIHGAAWNSCGPRHLCKPQRRSLHSGRNSGLLRTETLVNA